MGKLEFSAKVIEAVVWPLTLAIAAAFIYWKRGQGGAFFGAFFNRLREFSVGSVKVTLAETSSPSNLSTDVESAHYRRYTNGIIVQQIHLQASARTRVHLSFPIAFPNEVMSFQFVGSSPLPIHEATNTGLVLDLTSQLAPINFKLVITGL